MYKLTASEDTIVKIALLSYRDATTSSNSITIFFASKKCRLKCYKTSNFNKELCSKEYRGRKV